MVTLCDKSSLYIIDPWSNADNFDSFFCEIHFDQSLFHIHTHTFGSTNTGWTRLIQNLSSAKFCFKLCEHLNTNVNLLFYLLMSEETTG